MKPTTISKLKAGEFFKMKDTATSPVWVRDYYDRSLKAYWCYKFNDTNHGRFIMGKVPVYSDFEF